MEAFVLKEVETDEQHIPLFNKTSCWSSYRECLMVCRCHHLIYLLIAVVLKPPFAIKVNIS